MTDLRRVQKSPGRRAIRPAFVIGVLVVNGCVATAPPAASDSKAPLLSGTSWTATVVENDFTAGRRPTFQLRDDGKAAGSTGCTVYFASATVADSTMRIRNLHLEPETERRGTCDSLHLAQQARFLGALRSTRIVRKQAGRVLLLDARQNLLVLLERREDTQTSNGQFVSQVGKYAASLPDGTFNAAENVAARGMAYSANDPLKGMELVEVTPALGRYFGADAGVLVTRVPADNLFDLREGDVILSVNDRQPANAPHALRILRSYPPGTTLDLRVLRQHQSLNLRATLSE